MTGLTRPRVPAWLPPAACALPALALAVLLHRPLAGRAAIAVPVAALFDFTFSIPLLWWWLAVKGRGASRRSLVVVFVASMLAARLVVGGRTPVTTAWLGAVAGALELVLIARIALAVRAARRAREVDFAERVQVATAGLLGPGGVARAVGDELAILGYALLGPWWRPLEGPGRFSHHRDQGRGSLVAGLLMVLALEAGAVHAGMVHAHPRIAWTLTVSSLWGALWLFGDYQAMRLGRSTLGAVALELRVGLRARITVPYAAIAAVRSGRFEDLPRDRTLLRAYARPTTPTVLIELREPVIGHSMYRPSRSRMRIALAPDDLPRFLPALEAARSAATRDAASS